MPPLLSTVLVSNQVQLSLCGQPGTTFEIEYTTNQTGSGPGSYRLRCGQ